MKQFSKNFAVLVTTFGGLGFLPKAPGTFGSLAGLAVGVAIREISQRLTTDTVSLSLSIAIMLLALTILGWWTTHVVQQHWKTGDDGRIVIDEVVGQALTIAFFPPSLALVSAGFLLFRFFDIRKPGFIGWLDRQNFGAIGVMVDDIAAAIPAAILIFLARFFWSF